MGNKITAVKGMDDVYPPESWRWGAVERTAREIFESYGYDEMRVPIVERTELFVRGIGEVTDIVEKEMYTFDDKGTSLTLRPEGTASVVRAFVENGMATTDRTARYWYAGPMYRREKPQQGRKRQFYQVGVEAFGVTAPRLDAEVIAMLDQFLQNIGMQDYRIELNSLGDPGDRDRYREVLTEYLRGIEGQLSEVARARIATNPLRVLDSKADTDVTKDAPVLLDSIGDEARKHFEDVCAELDRLNVKFEINKRIVRGLDYYSRTTFEVVASAGLGSQNAVCGGGRYDGLVKDLGGPDIPGIGFAAGLERIGMVLDAQLGEPERPAGVYLVSTGERALEASLPLAQTLRQAGIRTEMDYKKANMKKQLGRADRRGAVFAIIIGDDELDAGEVTLRRMSDGNQERVALDKVATVVKDRLNGS